MIFTKKIRLSYFFLSEGRQLSNCKSNIIQESFLTGGSFCSICIWNYLWGLRLDFCSNIKYQSSSSIYWIVFKTENFLCFLLQGDNLLSLSGAYFVHYIKLTRDILSISSKTLTVWKYKCVLWVNSLCYFLAEVAFSNLDSSEEKSFYLYSGDKNPKQI